MSVRVSRGCDSLRGLVCKCSAVDAAAHAVGTLHGPRDPTGPLTASPCPSPHSEQPLGLAARVALWTGVPSPSCSVVRRNYGPDLITSGQGQPLEQWAGLYELEPITSLRDFSAHLSPKSDPI